MTTSLLEISARYFSEWRWLLYGLAPAVLLGATFIHVHRKPKAFENAFPKNASAVIAALAIFAALLWAWHLRWIADDAFISFRYARNLAQGNGLVFNPGERVEGYTNFLWTLLMAGAFALRLDPAQASLILSLAAFAAVLALTFRIVLRLSPPEQPVVFSWAVLLLGANYTFASFATSGLETMFATLLVTLAFERSLAGRFLAAGLAGIAAVLAHPDHALFYAALGGAIALDPKQRRGLIRYAAPFFLIYVPYFLWRWRYYGDAFPNTYYAKSAGLYYFRQGAVYIAASLIGGGLWGVLPASLYECWRRRGGLLGRYLLIVLPLYLLYVAKIGGDFMFGRLFCPLMPILFAAAELGARSLLSSRHVRLAAAALLFSVLAAIPVRILAPFEKKWLLADERTFYTLTSFSPILIDSVYFLWAETLKKTFVSNGLRPKIAVYCPGIIGYYTDLPLIDNFGLTDRHIAHQPLLRRDRPGHEKIATPDYLRQSDIFLSEEPVYPEPYAEQTSFRMEGLVFYMVHYRKDLLDALKGRPGVFFDESYLKNAEESRGTSW